jgi:hypothetical protein
VVAKKKAMASIRGIWIAPNTTTWITPDQKSLEESTDL